MQCLNSNCKNCHNKRPCETLQLIDSSRLIDSALQCCSAKVVMLKILQAEATYEIM